MSTKKTQNSNTSGNIEAAALPSIIRAYSTEGVNIEAAAADATPDSPKTFNATAYTGGQIRVPNFPLPVVVDLEGLDIPSQIAPTLYMHDQERPLGHSTAIDKSQQRIKVSGVLSQVGPEVDKIVASASRGYPHQVSIGVEPKQIVQVDRGQTAKINGRNHSGPFLHVKASLWRELSFVSLGADPYTNATIAAANLPCFTQVDEAAMTFSEYLAARNVEEKTCNETLLNDLRAAYKATQSTPPPVPDKPAENLTSLETVTAAARTEAKRHAAITAKVDAAIRANKFNSTKIDEFEQIGKAAIDGNRDLDWVETRLLVAQCAQAAPLVYSTTRGDCNQSVIEASLSMSGGLKNIDKYYDEKTLDAAHKQFGGGLGLQETIALCAAQAGWRGHNVGRDLKNALKAAFSIEASGQSTYSLPEVFSNVANKHLIDSFNFVEKEWSKIAGIGNFKDFKANTILSLTSDLTYQKIGKGGEIPHGDVGETSYTNKLETYGIQFGITRQDIVNDDQGALNQVPRRIGRGGALAINDLFWATFLNNATFFTAGIGNYSTGAGTAFSATSLGTADAAWALMVGPDGKPLGSQAKFLVVPKALRIAAQRLMNSQNLLTASDAGEANPWAGQFEVVSSSYLSNASLTGASALAWYLVADPNDLTMIQIAFLNGVQTPTIETVEMATDKLGISIRGYHDFGVALFEPLAAYKMKGEA